MAIIRCISALARRRHVAHIHHHVAEGLGKGGVPSRRTVSRQEDTIVTPVAARKALAGDADTVIGQVGDNSQRHEQTVADIRVAAGLHRKIPGAGGELLFVFAVERNPVAILAADVRRERPVI